MWCVVWCGLICVETDVPETRGAANLARTAGDAAAARVEADAMMDVDGSHPLDGGEENVNGAGDGDANGGDRGLTLLQERARVAAAQKKAYETEGPSAESQLTMDLEKTRDMLLIMDDEDESRGALEAAEAAFGGDGGGGARGQSRLGPDGAGAGASALRPLTEYEQAARKVRRHTLEVKAEYLAALVEGVEQRRVVALLRQEKNDCEDQIRAMRAAAVASKFKRTVTKNKDAAQERKVQAQGRWSSLGGAGLGSKMRAAAAAGGGGGGGDAGARGTPSPPQRAGGNVWKRLTQADETALGDGRRASSGTLVVPGGGGARTSTTGVAGGGGGGAPTSFSAMMRAAKAKAAASADGGGGGGGGGGGVGPWNSSPPTRGAPLRVGGGGDHGVAGRGGSYDDYSDSTFGGKTGTRVVKKQPLGTRSRRI